MGVNGPTLQVRDRLGGGFSGQITAASCEDWWPRERYIKVLLQIRGVRSELRVDQGTSWFSTYCTCTCDT